MENSVCNCNLVKEYMYNWSIHSNENANTNNVYLNNSQCYPFNRIITSSYLVEKELKSSTFSQNLLTLFKVRIGWHFRHYSCKVVLTYRVRLFFAFSNLLTGKEFNAQRVLITQSDAISVDRAYSPRKFHYVLTTA